MNLLPRHNKTKFLTGTKGCQGIGRQVENCLLSPSETNFHCVPEAGLELTHICYLLSPGAEDVCQYTWVAVCALSHWALPLQQGRKARTRISAHLWALTSAEGLKEEELGHCEKCINFAFIYVVKGCTCATDGLWRSENKCWQSVLFVYQVDSRDWTWVTKLGTVFNH